MADRGIPEFNRLIAQRQNAVNRAFHTRRLRDMHKSIDNDVPATTKLTVLQKPKGPYTYGKQCESHLFCRAEVRNSYVEQNVAR